MDQIQDTPIKQIVPKTIASHNNNVIILYIVCSFKRLKYILTIVSELVWAV